MKVSEFLRMMPDAWRKDQQVRLHLVFEDNHVSTMTGDAPWILDNIPADYDLPVKNFHTMVEYNNEKPVAVLYIGAWS